MSLPKPIRLIWRHLLAHKKHGLYLLITVISIFCLVEVFLFGFQNYESVIYPVFPRKQQSPKQVLNGTNLPTSQWPLIIEHGSRYQYRVALTFDADVTLAMEMLWRLKIVKSWYDPEIKKTLDHTSTKATIFFSRRWLNIYPNQAKELASDPLIEVGNMADSNSQVFQGCKTLSNNYNFRPDYQIETVQNQIKSLTNLTPKYFRFPGDCFDGDDLKLISQLGLTVIHWDVASGDGLNNDVDKIIKNVESTAGNGSIIVFHLQGVPMAPLTNQALQQIIPDLQHRGFQMVTISELLGGPSSN